MDKNIQAKVCNKCNITKNINLYTKNKRYKDGKEPICKDCNKEKYEKNKEKNAEAVKKWRVKNPDYMKVYGQSEKSKEYHKQYYKENSEIYKDRKKAWRAKNPDKEKETRAKYNEENKEKLNEYHRKWKEKKRSTDINYKLQSNISRRIRYELNTLLKGKKVKRTTKYLGCSIEELKVFLEKKFTNGITWENYGSIWHIDHIIPCSSWNFTSEFDSKCCWNYRNLQPMLASQNQIKHDSFNEDEKQQFMEKMKIIFQETA
jgi:hypothetical protein